MPKKVIIKTVYVCFELFFHHINRFFTRKSGDLRAECTEVRFACFLFGGFITAIVVNSPERKLAKRTSVECFNFNMQIIFELRTCYCINVHISWGLPQGCIHRGDRCQGGQILPTIAEVASKFSTPFKIFYIIIKTQCIECNFQYYFAILYSRE